MAVGHPEVTAELGLKGQQIISRVPRIRVVGNQTCVFGWVVVNPEVENSGPECCDVLSPASSSTVRFSFFLLEKLVEFVCDLM